MPLKFLADLLAVLIGLVGFYSLGRLLVVVCTRKHKLIWEHNVGLGMAFVLVILGPSTLFGINLIDYLRILMVLAILIIIVLRLVVGLRPYEKKLNAANWRPENLPEWVLLVSVLALLTLTAIQLYQYPYISDAQRVHFEFIKDLEDGTINAPQYLLFYGFSYGSMLLYKVVTFGHIVFAPQIMHWTMYLVSLSIIYRMVAYSIQSRVVGYAAILIYGSITAVFMSSVVPTYDHVVLMFQLLFVHIWYDKGADVDVRRLVVPLLIFALVVTKIYGVAIVVVVAIESMLRRKDAMSLLRYGLVAIIYSLPFIITVVDNYGTPLFPINAAEICPSCAFPGIGRSISILRYLLLPIDMTYALWDMKSSIGPAVLIMLPYVIVAYVRKQTFNAKYMWHVIAIYFTLWYWTPIAMLSIRYMMIGVALLCVASVIAGYELYIRWRKYVRLVIVVIMIIQVVPGAAYLVGRSWRVVNAATQDLSTAADNMSLRYYPDIHEAVKKCKDYQSEVQYTYGPFNWVKDVIQAKSIYLNKQNDVDSALVMVWNGPLSACMVNLSQGNISELDEQLNIKGIRKNVIYEKGIVKVYK